MPRHHRLVASSFQGQTSDRHETTVGLAGGPGVERPGTNGLSLVLAAAADAHVSEKEMYLSLGITDASYWSKVKVGLKPAPRIDLLLNLPKAVQRETCRRWARMLNLRVRDEDTREVFTALIKAAADALEAIA
jgi:hypothetical protein